MKLGFISDIHSNYRAFKACLDYFEKENVDTYFLLGDYVSDTAYPEKTMELIYELKKRHKCIIIRGNREEYFINNEMSPTGWHDGSATGNLLYTREHLTAEDISFFKTLPIVERFEVNGYPSITVCHGSPKSDREHIYPLSSTITSYSRLTATFFGSSSELSSADSKNSESDMNNQSETASKDSSGKWNDTPDAAKWLSLIDTDILVSAHTHQRCIYEHNRKIYVNTGSCGIAISNSGIAECAIFESIEQKNINKSAQQTEAAHGWSIRLLSIPYDVKSVIKDIFESGLYNRAHWFINSNIQTLSTGIDHASDMVIRACELDFAKKAANTWPDIDEISYEKAASELGIPDYRNVPSIPYIRMAIPDDAERLLEIYTPYVKDTAITFEYEVPTIVEFQNRIIEKLQKNPYFVAEYNGRILGYAYASPFRTRAAYAKDVELSIYVDRTAHRLGIGTLLLQALEEALKRRGLINIYAIIVGSDDTSDPYLTGESLSFHQKNGYVEEGCLHNVGEKFGRWYHTYYLSKKLN